MRLQTVLQYVTITIILSNSQAGLALPIPSSFDLQSLSYVSREVVDLYPRTHTPAGHPSQAGDQSGEQSDVNMGSPNPNVGAHHSRQRTVTMTTPPGSPEIDRGSPMKDTPGSPELNPGSPMKDSPPGSPMKDSPPGSPPGSPMRVSTPPMQESDGSIHSQSRSPTPNPPQSRLSTPNPPPQSRSPSPHPPH